MASRDVKVNILGDSRDFSRAVGQAQRDATNLQGSFSSVSSGFSRMAGGIALGAAGVAAGMAVAGTAMVFDFVRAAEESAQVTRQTTAVLESMGATAWTTAEGVAALSTELSNRTGIDDELIQSGQNVLLTFGQVQNRVGEGRNIFDRATEAALNMSVALGTDMTAASMMIGKALNDPIRGLTQLRRSGIQFTEQQEEQIRAMVAAGDVAGAQTVMLAELDRQFGGSAEAQATASQRIATMWDNLKEKLGEQLLPAFEGIADWLSNHLPGIIETAGEWFGKLSEKMAPVVQWVQDNWPTIAAKIREVLADIKAQLETFWGYVTGAWQTFGANVLSTSNGTWNGLIQNASGSLEMLRGIGQTVMGLMQGDWSKAWDGIKKIFDGAWRGILGAQAAAGALAYGAMRAIATAITEALKAAWNGFANWWNGLPDIHLPEAETPFGSFGGGTIGIPDMPTFHQGGTYRAPTPGGEGLAMLRDGERVLTPAQDAASRGGGPVTIILQVDKYQLGRATFDSLDALTKSDGPLNLRIA